MAFSQATPYQGIPLNRPRRRRVWALATGAGRWLRSFFRPAPYATAQTLLVHTLLLRYVLFLSKGGSDTRPRFDERSA